jgi:hypothetical protein
MNPQERYQFIPCMETSMLWNSCTNCVDRQQHHPECKQMKHNAATHGSGDTHTPILTSGGSGNRSEMLAKQ